MHIPSYAETITADESPQIRLLLVGPPKSGKTWSAATFPNPIFADFDNGLTSRELREKGIRSLPFYDTDWITNHFPKRVQKSALGTKVQAASAFVEFLNSPDLAKMTLEQTLVVDSLSTLADAVRDELEPATPVGKNGEKDTFWFWREWSTWFRSLCTKFKSLNCHVILIAHEQEIRDAETGRVNAFKFALQGQEFSPRLPQFFTDIYRQTKDSKDKPGSQDKSTKQVEEVYLWQVKTSPQFMCNTRMKTTQQFVPATYASIKY